MKKNLFILAATATALASCSNDVTTAVNTTLNAPQEITFRTTADRMTRAADINLTTLQGSGFYVSARNSDNTVFSDFTDKLFSYSDGFWTCSPAYLWPSSGDLDFYAYAPAASGQITAHADYKSFAVTPSATAADQIDLVFANANGKNKTNSGTGVALNFRHAESMVAINLKNSNAGMTMTVGNVVIGNVKNSGTYSYEKIAAGTTAASTYLLLTDWNTTSAPNTTYTQPVTDGLAYSSATAAQAGVDMILIPQAMTAVSTYASDDAGAAFNGPYITVQLKIQQGGAYIVGTEGAFVTAMWPLPTLTWDPGHKYTYIIDLSTGGYYTTNQDGTTDALDRILSGSDEIKFASVTVDTWDTTSPAGDQTFSM